MSGKATKAEVARRVEAVFELRLGGATFADIREYATAPTDREGQKLPPWDVSDSQLWRYIARADALCKERCDARAGHLLARHLLRRERLYAHALDVGDYKTALAVLKDQAQLEGVYEARERPGQTAAGGPEAGEASRLGTGDVVSVLSERLRQVSQADLPTAEKARMSVALADALLRALTADELEKRVAELERRAAAQGDRGAA